MSKARKRYLVTERTSTRRSPDPVSPEYETWVDFAPGQVVTSWPAHAPVAEWVDSGHWAEKKAGAA
jgi:hypothetical protein